MTFATVDDATSYLARVGFERKGPRRFVRRGARRRKEVAVIEPAALQVVVLFF